MTSLPVFTWMPMPHLPAVPEKFIATAKELIDNQHNLQSQANNHCSALDQIDDYKNRKLKLTDGQEISTRMQAGIEMPQEWHQWIKQNIVELYLTAGLRISIGNGDTHGPHCDFRRQLKLMVLLSRGNENTETVYYQEKGKSIVRNEIADHDVDSVVCNDYGQMVEIDRVKWPIGSWILHNSMVLHGVTNVTGVRSNFTVSVPVDFDLIFNNLK